MKKALVIGEDTRSFLSVIRSLGQLNLQVDVVCFDQTSPALASKYIHRAWYYNYQSYTNEDWIAQVIKLINEQAYDLVFPCDERAIFPLIKHKAAINEHCQLALPNDEVRENLFDKHLTKQVAMACNVRVAKGDLHDLDQFDYHTLSETYTNKFVIKPTESFNEDKLSARNKVAIVENQEQYNDYLKRSNIEGQEFLIEEYFSGTGEGVSLFACKGEVQYLFAHTRVSEPRTGGGSSYRKAIPVDPTMADACIAMCKATHYDGVGMFEFKKNYTTNEWILVEVNARFWGSLPLAIHAGIDFPRYYAQYLLGTYQPRSTPSTDYNLKAYARSFSNDMYDIRAEMQFITAHEGRIAGLAAVAKRLATYHRVLHGEKIDSYDKQDKAPFTAEYKKLFNETIGDKLKRKLPAWLTANGVDQEELMRQLLTEMYALEGKGRLLFVCYGNIMRSPLAGEFANMFMHNTKLKFTVESYGFHQNTGRQSPDECQRAAAQLGLDLTQHRSRLLLQKEITDNDIVFIFDEHNQQKLAQFYQVKRVYNLAHFIPVGLGRHHVIADPYGHGDDAVNNCYKLIIEALKNVFERYLSLS